MNKKFLLFLIGFFFIIFLGGVFALNISLSDQGTDVKDKTSGDVLTSGNLIVSIYDNLTGGNLIYNETFEDAIVNGSWNVMLGENSSNPLELEFGEIYYKDYAINSLDLDFTDYQGNTVERQFFYSPLGEISDEDISESANLTISGLNVSNNITVDNADFSGGWLNNGVSIINGGIYAQVGYFYNITSLNVTRQNLTIIDDFYALGKVGIGTTTPQELLHIKTGGLLATPVEGIRWSYDDTTYVSSIDTIFHAGVVANNKLVFKVCDGYTTGQTEVLTMVGNGNVGIGTTSPGYHLVIDSKSAGIGTLQFKSSSYDATGQQLILFSDRNSDNGGIFFNHADNALRFNTGGIATANIRLFIEGTGNVGINTTTPQNTLNVVGDINFTGLIYGNGSQLTDVVTSPEGTEGAIQYYDGGSFGGNASQFYINKTSGNVGIGTGSPGKIDDFGPGAVLQVGNQALGNPTVRIAGGNTKIELERSDTTKLCELKYYTGGSVDWNVGVADSDFAGDGTEFYIGTSTGGSSPALWIETSGNVGIGTTSPDNLLSIYNTTANYQMGLGYNGTYYWKLGRNVTDGSFRIFQEHGEITGDRFVVDAEGDVGIGTTSPGTILDIVTAVNKGIRVSDGTSTGILYPSGTLTNSVAVGSTTNVPLIFGTNNVFPQMVIQNGTGNVGIGTSSPQSLLHTKSSTTNTLTIESDSSNAILTLDGGAGVGSNDSIIRFTKGGTNIWALYRDASFDSDLEIYNYPRSEWDFVIKNNTGNVGIGTTSPNGKLNVIGEIQANATSVGMPPFRAMTTTGLINARLGSWSNDDGALALEDDESNLQIVLLADGDSYINTGGNVGIGTTTPWAKLNIEGKSDEIPFIVQGEDAMFDIHTFFYIENITGNVGIGTTSPETVLHIKNSTSHAKLTIESGASFEALVHFTDGTARGAIASTSNDGLGFRTGGSLYSNTRMVIDSTGDVLIGGPYIPQSLLHLRDGIVNLRLEHTSGNIWVIGGGGTGYDFSVVELGSGTRFLIKEGGNIGIGRTPTTNNLEVEGTASKTASGDWLANSDRRIKTNIQNISNALKIISELRPVKFKYTEEYKQNHSSVEDKYYYNFIAQEYMKVFPESVYNSGEFLKDGSEILQMDSYNAQVVAIRAIQELKAEKDDEIWELRQENQAQQLEIDVMRQALCEMGRKEFC